MFYIRLFLVVAWLCISCMLFLVLAPFRWKNPSYAHDYGRFLGPMALKILGIRLKVEGGPLTAHQPCIYVSNHQGNIDVFTFGSIYPPKTITIAKKQLIWIPFFGVFFVASGNILIDRKNRSHSIGGLNQAVQALKERGTSIWIMPEGTRNKTSEPLLPFKKGAFYMAIEAQVPIVPIVSAPIRTVVRWKERVVRPGELRVRILPAIDTKGLTSTDVEKVMRQAREGMLAALQDLS